MRKATRLLLLLLLFLSFLFIGCDFTNDNNNQKKENIDEYTYDLNGTKSSYKANELEVVDEATTYIKYLSVASYIYSYHHLPSNYLTKSEAQSLGWCGSGNLWVNNSLLNRTIGGDKFNNYEGYLPASTYYIELDVNCTNGNRGSNRIVYSTYTFDIYYTNDHYASFTYIIGGDNGISN